MTFLEEKVLNRWRFIIHQKDNGVRLDHFLCNQDIGITRSQLKHYIEDGHATIDGEQTRPAKKLQTGQIVELQKPAAKPLIAQPQEIPLDIQYEDDHLIVVNKPQDLVVHPAAGHPDGTLVNGILFACSIAGGDPLRPGIVHRLDKDTSGLMVIAKNESVHSDLAVQFHDHTVDRRYAVLVAGNPPFKGEWRTLHGRKMGDRRRFTTKVTKGKQAISIFETQKLFNGAALIKVTLHTGRTHQVRVHCHDHGFPVLGDPWYGPKHLSPVLKQIHNKLYGQALHAEVLGFKHPHTKERMFFTIDPPNSFKEALENLEQKLI